MTIVPVPAAGIYAMWSCVRDGILRVLEKTNDHFLPENVFTELMLGKAVLFRIEDEGDEVGFLVVKQVQDPDGMALFIWVAYAETGMLMGKRNEFLEALDFLTKSTGCKRVRHYSPRGGFLDDGAFKLKMHIYEREVDYG